jgi:UDP-glucuronate 4-epimerase
MKILVTGSAGFIGFHLVNRLIAEKHEVVGIDSINHYYDVNLKYARLAQTGLLDREAIDGGRMVQSSSTPHYRFQKMLLEEQPALEALFAAEKFEVVVHLAAQAGVRYSITNPDAYVQSNIVGFLNMLECAKKHRIQHFVYASSSSVYGLNSSLPFSTADSVDHPVSLYAASKKSNELMAHVYSHLHQLPTTGLRFFTVYGPWGRPDMALFLFTEAIAAGKSINIFNNGEMMRDFTYVDDVIEGIYRLLQQTPAGKKDWTPEMKDASSSSAPYKVFNIGNSKPVNLLEFVEAIEKKLGVTAEKNFLPMQPGDVKATFADVADLMQYIGYKPGTSIENGVHQFIDWYKAYYKI